MSISKREKIIYSIVKEVETGNTNIEKENSKLSKTYKGLKEIKSWLLF